MKSSEILREAARRIELGKDQFGCHAIFVAMGGNMHTIWPEPEWDSHIMRRFRVVAPSKAKNGNAWWDTYSEARIIGLCLAAAIAESEGD